jgi:acyl-CoA thioester hydrolase
MEQARIEWIASLGLSVHLEEEGPVIINTSCTFLKPMSYPGLVEIRTHVDPPGRSSVQTHMDMLIDGELYAQGAAKIVWTNRQTGKSIPLPDHMRTLLEAE